MGEALKFRLIFILTVGAIFFSFIFDTLAKTRIESCKFEYIEKREYLATVITNNYNPPNNVIFVFATNDFFIQDATGMWSHMGVILGNNSKYTFKVHYFGQGRPTECPVKLPTES